jgi:hypothetical protein
LTKLPLNISPLLPVSPRNQTEKVHGKSAERYTNWKTMSMILLKTAKNLFFDGRSGKATANSGIIAEGLSFSRKYGRMGGDVFRRFGSD